MINRNGAIEKDRFQKKFAENKYLESRPFQKNMLARQLFFNFSFGSHKI